MKRALKKTNNINNNNIIITAVNLIIKIKHY